MSKKNYTAEYRAHLVALFKDGRSAESLAREYEPSSQTIRNWVQAAEGGDKRTEVDLQAELRALRAENAKLREEREILKKAAAWFAKESASDPKKGSRS